jgi:hypothetical protein
MTRTRLSLVQRRLLDTHMAILATPPDELSFLHTVSCQCALPARRPPPGVIVWQRQQGRAALLVEAGRAWHPVKKAFVQLPLPFGPKARLVLMHLNTEAIRSRSPVVEVERSLTAFARRLLQGNDPNGREIRAIKEQLSALSTATIRLAVDAGDAATQINTQIVGALDLWPDDEDARQRVLWPATVRLSTDYFESLARHAVPLDERAVAALAHSATALDIYAWLAQRLHRIPPGRPQFVPWPALHEQFGQGFARLRAFREHFLEVLRQVASQYPEAKVEADRQAGLTLAASPPPVLKRFVSLAPPG